MAAFSRFFLLFLIVPGLSGCQEGELRGVLVARFLEENQIFIKRIFVPSLNEPELRLRLTNKTHSCELRALVPKDLPPETTDCLNISGTGKLFCSDAREINLAWKMSSCHSGFGRSLDGSQPVFIFGFSGNQNNAQDQFELAKEAHFAPAEDNTPAPVAPPPSGFGVLQFLFPLLENPPSSLYSAQ